MRHQSRALGTDVAGTHSAADSELAVVAAAIAEPSRATMLSALMTGTAWTVGELASWAGVARSTASEHVTALSSVGLVHITRQGRHAYVTLAGADVAAALEALSLIAPDRPAPPSLRGHREAQALDAGRTCYRHLAGLLGVQIADQLRKHDLLTAETTLTEAGWQWFAVRGIDTRLPAGRAPLRPCLDWTQRRPHLAGALADRLTAKAFEQHWIERGSHPRSVRLTRAGADQLFAGAPAAPTGRTDDSHKTSPTEAPS